MSLRIEFFIFYIRRKLEEFYNDFKMEMSLQENCCIFLYGKKSDFYIKEGSDR